MNAGQPSHHSSNLWERRRACKLSPIKPRSVRALEPFTLLVADGDHATLLDDPNFEMQNTAVDNII
jgi:hypothetical protein